MLKGSVRAKHIVAAIALALSGGTAYAGGYESEMIILHPFQWHYNNIAKECTEYLGPAGFDGVQISQPAEHINRTDVWWAVYQPVNFKNFTTMTGNEQELKAMIKACNDAGVKVFADAVVNQRASGGGTGLGGSSYGNGSGYQDGFDGSDFRTGCTINNYGDANHVRTCCLSGMPDTKTDNPSTQEKIADYFVRLHDMGIYGFRIDAAKHMGYTDIKGIFDKVKAKLGKCPPSYYEVIGSGGEADDIQPRKYVNNENNVVTDFTYVNSIKGIFDSGNFGGALNLGCGDVGCDDAEVFVNNHDNEALRCSAGTCSMGTQNNPKYHMAQSWMVVWPAGKVRQVYSGYAFSQHDPAGPISAARCEGGWLCQHREPMVLNAARFARATRDQGVTSKGFDNGALWINRGNKGFYVMNTTGGDFTREFSVEVPDGTYCDILSTVDPCGGAKIQVSGGKATFTVKGQKAAAICVGEWCGETVDPCETDPNSAQCLCKDDSDKNTCSAYCATSAGQNSASCLCKGEETDKNGLCASYCQVNSSDANCYCVLNPEAEECATQYTTTKNLCFAGTPNGWEQSKMTFNGRTGKWSIDLEISGSGDANGAERFKVTDGCSWSGTVYGVGSGSNLAVNGSASGDVPINVTGSYTLTVDDATMAYQFVKKATTNKDPVAGFSFTKNDLTVKFTNTSKDDDGDTLSYSWDFGDGQTSTEANPTVTYGKKGSYQVKLTVKDGNGGSNTKTATVDVIISDDTQVYKKVALRASENQYSPVLFTSKGNDVWVLDNYEFTGTSNKLKIEALSDSQCVIVGGKLGQKLTAAGGFISVEPGEYKLTFNARTGVLTMEQAACDNCGPTEPECKGDKCGTACNAGSDCVDGICQGTDCSNEQVTPPSGNTKENCSADNTTNNCEVAANAYDFLGAQYSPTSTTFRIWSPDSGNVTVDVDGKTYNLTKTSINGYSDVYEVVVEGDLDLKPYQFKINGTAVRDPYGKMVVPSSYSGSDGVSSSANTNIVMNMRATDLEGGWAPRPGFVNREDAIIYEAHVRAYTNNSSSGVSADKKGRYLGMVETGTKSPDGLATGIDHLKELGITHVQLLPVYDYGSCSDVDSQNAGCYNWGYDPVNFNVPEDRYTSVFNTEQYRQKVKEFKEMVNEFHKNGIRVIMDVVYNHSYNKEQFQSITGKYYTSTDLSGCGNSIDSTQDMVRRFIRDSLEYWATEYNIDGFRFDLVGIFDTNSFKEWGEYMNNKYPSRTFLMYGEPWNGFATDTRPVQPVRMGTIRQAASGHVGIFNGKYRECVKGGSDDAVGGFMFNKTYHDLGGLNGNVECVSAGIKGALGDGTSEWTPLFAADPEQSINYLTAHDNLTLADKINKMGATGEYARRLQAYANGIILVSQGIPFLHSGVEFMRDKNGDHNSYKSTGGVNDIKWGNKKTYKEVFDYYKGMIEMRKAHPAFRMTTKDQVFSNVSTKGENGAIVVDINGAAVGDSWSNIKLVINSGNDMTIGGVDGWKKKVNGVTVNADGQTGSSSAEGSAVTVWYK